MRLSYVYALLPCLLLLGCDTGSDVTDPDSINGTWLRGDNEFEEYIIIDNSSLVVTELNEFSTPDCWFVEEWTLTHTDGINYVLTMAGEEPVEVSIFREDDVLTITGDGDADAYELVDNAPDFEPECD